MKIILLLRGPEDIYAGLNSRTYSVQIKQNNDIETLFIDCVERGVIVLNITNLKIDDGLIADGFITEFER